MYQAKHIRQIELNLAARERCRYAIVLQTATSKERSQSLIHDYKKTLQHVAYLYDTRNALPRINNSDGEFCSLAYRKGFTAFGIFRFVLVGHMTRKHAHALTVTIRLHKPMLNDFKSNKHFALGVPGLTAQPSGYIKRGESRD
jgi:hypothetical protein